MLDDQIVILCGGQGTRVRSVIGNKPKILMPILNKTFLEIQLIHYYEKGFKNFFYIVGFGGEQVINELQIFQKRLKDINISYHSEGDIRLGTGGSILSCIDKLDDRFLLTYGDNFLRLNFKKFSEEFRLSSKNFMTIYKNSNLIEPSNIYCDESRKRIIAYDKFKRTKNFKHIDYGFFGIIKDSFLSKVPSNPCFDLNLFIQQSIGDDIITPFFTSDRFYDIGNPKAIEEFTNFYSKNL